MPIRSAGFATTSLWFTAVANLKEVKEAIGHSDISMTDRYSRLIPLNPTI